MGAIGNNFHVVGFGQLGTSGQDEMLMQDAAGDFEVYQYNASLNAFVGNSMGTVGAPWVVDGIAADPRRAEAHRRRSSCRRWRRWEAGRGQHCERSYGWCTTVAANPSHDAAACLTEA